MQRSNIFVSLVLIQSRFFRRLMKKTFHMGLICFYYYYYYFHDATQQPLVGQGLLLIEASRSQSPHSVGLRWTSDHPTQRTLPDKTQHSQQTDIPTPGGIQTRHPHKRGLGPTPQTARPLGQIIIIIIIIINTVLWMESRIWKLKTGPMK
jgi:hypothetical protein